MKNFEIKIEGEKRGFSKSQLEKWAEEIHGPGAKINVEEVES